MKKLLQQLHVVTAVQLQPKAKVLYDAEVKPAKVLTQADIDKAFKAGKAKATQDKELQEKMDKLARLEREEVERTEANALAGIATALKADDLKDAGLNAGAIAKVATEFKEQLKGKSGNALLAEINKIKEDEANALYFAESNASASESLRDAGQPGGGKAPVKQKFYPGSSIPMEN